MKRRLKSLFKISVACVTFGAMVTIIGLLLGGAGELSKEVTELVHVIRIGVSKTVERIPMLESITNLNDFTLVVDVSQDGVSIEVNEEYETISGDYSDLNLANASDVENLNISIMSGTCSILPSSNGCYGVESTGAGKYQCYVSDGTLFLNAFPEETGKSEDAEIVLYIPEECEYGKVFLFCSGDRVIVKSDLKGDSLDIGSICGVNNICGVVDFTEVTITAGTGKTTLSSLLAVHLKLEVGTAEVFLDDMSVDDMEVNLGMGKIYVKGTTTGDIVLNCGMGNMEMLLSDAQDAYNYDISGSAESVQIGTDTLAGMVMERWIDNGSDRKITMSCSMGSVKIEFEQ